MNQRGRHYNPLFQRVSEERIRLMLEAELSLEFPCDGPEPLMEFSQSDTDKIERIVRAELKSKETDERILKLVRNILVQLFKQLYTRRNIWKDGLSLQTD